MDMFDKFIMFIRNILAIWGFLSLMGFVIYKTLHLDTWEHGLIKAFSATVNFIYEGCTGKSSQEADINTALICYDKEALEIVSKLNRHPYETPSLESYIPNWNACSWYDIGAVGLAPLYKDLENRQIAEMADKIIKNYFMETREVQVNIYIKVASPTRLHFCIPLSEEGIRFMESQSRGIPSSRTAENTSEFLEEEFDIFSDSSDDQE